MISVLTVYGGWENPVDFSVFDVWTWYFNWHSWQVTWRMLARPMRDSPVTCRSDVGALHVLHHNSSASTCKSISRRPVRFGLLNSAIEWKIKFLISPVQPQMKLLKRLGCAQSKSWVKNIVYYYLFTCRLICNTTFFVSGNNILSPLQFTFRAKSAFHSAPTALTLTLYCFIRHNW